MRTNLLLIAATLLLAFSACNKVSENVQRDIIFSPDSVAFKIPITTRDSILINNLPNSVNIADSIAAIKGGDQFSVNNISKATLSSLSITLTDTLDVKNNFANIQSIKVNLNGTNRTDSLATVTNPSDAPSRNLSLNSVILSETLKEYLVNGNLKYSVIIRFKRPMTKELNAKISTTYTLTLKK